MPTIADVPPATVRGDLTTLRNALDQSIPDKDPHDNLLMGRFCIPAGNVSIRRDSDNILEGTPTWTLVV
jgi:hypothetical protein